MKPVVILSLFATVVLVLAGCRGIPAPGERQERHDFGSVADEYRPQNRPAVLPELTAQSSLSNFVEYALLNSPAVGAAYYDWSVSVENITVARSMPDPQLTFQAYIQNMITSLMPGFAWNFPGPGKLKVRGKVAVVESQGKYFTFESAVLQTAFNLKQSYYQLGLLEEQIQLKHETIVLLESQEQALRAQNTANEATLSDLLRVESELDRARNELSNMNDSFRPALESFKAALGLAPGQRDPPIPAHFEAADTSPEALLAAALQNNPQLKAMEADVRKAEAEITAAYKERVPDFSVALMADAKASPVLYWPQAAMSLPIWRDKIAAEIAGAKAEELAAQSRLKAGQIELVVSFAEKSFACRQTGRNLALIENELIPRARESLEIEQAGYRAGAGNFSGLTDAELALVDLKNEAIQAQTDHEIALADLSLMVAGLPPTSAPLLSATH
jgi:cobalt-zinc-cadmium efflux system outer membrane protein